MSKAQYLLAHFNPVGIDLQRLNPSTADSLTAMDIAAALSGVKREAYLVIRYLWCDDVSVLREITQNAFQAVKVKHPNIPWERKSNHERFSSMVKVSLSEIQQVNLCKKCSGTGIQTHNICHACGGGGTKPLTESMRAKKCGLVANNWQSYWGEKYEMIFIQLIEWNEIGLKHLLTKL